MQLSKKNQQIYLQRLGYYCDLIDGIKGEKHKNALIAFKKANGLSANSDYGSKTDKALRAAYKMRDKNKLSKHFKKSEFKCGCRGKYCDGYPVTVNPKLIGILEKLRSYYGEPITITSGLRCKKHNNSLAGSSKTSAHLKGKAADIYIPGAKLSSIKSKAYAYGAAYSYYGTPGMGNAIHINI